MTELMHLFSMISLIIGIKCFQYLKCQIDNTHNYHVYLHLSKHTGT